VRESPIVVGGYIMACDAEADKTVEEGRASICGPGVMSLSATGREGGEGARAQTAPLSEDLSVGSKLTMLLHPQRDSGANIDESTVEQFLFLTVELEEDLVTGARHNCDSSIPAYWHSFLGAQGSSLRHP
jgi:hypothetical protein